MPNEFNIKNGFISNSDSRIIGGLTASTISATTYQNLPSATFSGGTVNGATNFTNGLTTTTISATTYLNLPPDLWTQNGTSIYYNTGNVGVGITNPTAKLHITQTGTGNSFLVEDSTNPDTTPFVINNLGDVGVGTLTPTTKLEVIGDFKFGPFGGGALTFGTYQYGTDFDMSPITGPGGWARAHRIKTSDSSGSIFFGAQGTGTGLTKSFWTIDTPESLTFNTTTNGIHLLKNGNVGVGITNPTAKLHITQTGTVNSFLVEDSTNPDTTPFIINAIGNVGIGTTTPAAKLHLYHDTYELLLIERSGSLNVPIQYTNAAGTMYAGLSSNGKFTIGESPDLTINTSAFLTVSASGNVGIGTTVPSTNLHVSGNTLISGNLSATTISATTYLNLPTDIRVTGGTYTAGTATFTNNTGGTFSVTGFAGNYWSSGSTGTYSLKAINDSGLDATGDYSIAMNYNTLASGLYSHAEGENTTASGQTSHAEGISTIAGGYASHVEGHNTTASGDRAHAEGNNSIASGDQSHAEGNFTISSGGFGSHSEGDRTLAGGYASHAEGSYTTASANYSHSEGYQTIATGITSHAEGSGTTASGITSHAEGDLTQANGDASHAEGFTTIADGYGSHAEGYVTKASGDYSHAEGSQTTASGIASHAEGSYTIAFGSNSHAEGSQTIASGTTSHAGGSGSIAQGEYSFVHGLNSNANGNHTVVFGNNITGTADDTVYTPYLNIQSAQTNNALTKFLVRETDGTIKVKDLNNLAFTNIDNNFSSSQTINGGLTVNGNTITSTLSATSITADTVTTHIPFLAPQEIYRGITFSNNSTTVTTAGGVTMSTTASNLAQSVASTNFASKQIRLRYYSTTVSGGRYTGTRGSALLWYIHGGFRYICDFRISDTSYASDCQQFYGLAGQTTDLAYGTVSLVQVSTLTNLIGVGNDGSDTNLQIIHNDGSGTATKIDLGSDFPANRTAGAVSTTMYSVTLYNAPASNTVKYMVVNNETGAVAMGAITTDLPATTQGLNFFASRAMGGGGGVTGSGQFELSKLGVNSLL